MAIRLTEQPSLYDHLEKKSVAELIHDINQEDKKVALAIEKVLPEIEKLTTAIENTIRGGGRMFWLGCGTGGKLAVLDVLEVPNTYGVFLLRYGKLFDGAPVCAVPETATLKIDALRRAGARAAGGLDGSYLLFRFDGSSGTAEKKQ